MPISLTSPNTDNYYIGKGIVSIKLPTDPDYVDVGNVPEFEFTPELDRLDHFSSRSGVRSKDRSVVREKSATLRIVMEEWTARNLSFALLGALNVSNPDAVTIDIFSENVIEAAVKFVGQNEIGPQWTFEFPSVEFAPSAALNPISDEWGQIEIEGEVLFDEEAGNFGTATADFGVS